MTATCKLLPLLSLALCTEVGCKKSPAHTAANTGPTVVPAANLFLRNAFDTDPSVYIGRFGTDQNEQCSPTVREAARAPHRGRWGSPAPLIKRRRWGGEAVSASDRGGRICLPPEKRGAAISADIVGGNGRCLRA